MKIKNKLENRKNEIKGQALTTIIEVKNLSKQSI